MDHIVLTVRDIARSVDFYCNDLGMTAVRGARVAVRFGNQKINLHRAGGEHAPFADKPTPGSADVCLLVGTPMSQVLRSLALHRVELMEGPVLKQGATGSIVSVYVRDPDGNLLELAVPEGSAWDDVERTA